MQIAQRVSFFEWCDEIASVFLFFLYIYIYIYIFFFFYLEKRCNSSFKFQPPNSMPKLQR